VKWYLRKNADKWKISPISLLWVNNDCGSEKMLRADNLMGQVRKLGKIM